MEKRAEICMYYTAGWICAQNNRSYFINQYYAYLDNMNRGNASIHATFYLISNHFIYRLTRGEKAELIFTGLFFHEHSG